ncbi:MAG: RNA polymerase sigma factor [Verrucomicrobiales bacterium]
MRTTGSTETVENQPQDPFTTTAWTVVISAVSDSPGAKDALEKLCQTYWYPVYSYIRHRGYGPHDAEDLTQEFFYQVVNMKRLRSPDRTKGRFRAYLLTAVNGLLANDWHAKHAAKRGGGAVIESLDAKSAEERYASEPMGGRSPEDTFDRRWAMTVLEQVHGVLREEFRNSGRPAIFDEAGKFLLAPLEKPGSAGAAENLGMTANALAVTVHRLRHRFRNLLRKEVARTVGDPGEVDDEMKHLLALLNEV